MTDRESSVTLLDMANDIPSLIPQADTYLDNGFNLLLIGLHGTGKTQTILDLAASRGMKMKYYSCSTLDPYTDLVGVPVPKQYCETCHEYFDQNTHTCPEGHTTAAALKMVRPREVDEAEFIFFDEFNRADPKTLNAIFEIIQFKSINGEPLPNLQCCWAAMNPPEDQYQVEEVDPALLDRFDLYIPIDPHPSSEYMAQFMNPKVANALRVWWEDHGKQVRQRAAKTQTKATQSAGNSRIDYISPRRLLKIGLVWEATKNSKSVKAALPIGGTFDTGKLIELLKAAEKGPTSKSDPGMGDSATDEFTYSAAWMMMNRKKVTEWLTANPNALETHKKVLDTLAQGVGGMPLVEKYGDILNACQPSLLEGFFTAMPDIKKSQMRAGFKQVHKANRSKAKTMTNLYKVLEKGARAGSMPDITT